MNKHKLILNQHMPINIIYTKLHQLKWAEIIKFITEILVTAKTINFVKQLVLQKL